MVQKAQTTTSSCSSCLSANMPISSRTRVTASTTLSEEASMARFPKREDRVNDTLSGKGSGKGLGRIVNPDLKRLAILAVVVLATPATADPAEDTVHTIGKEWCENH